MILAALILSGLLAADSANGGEAPDSLPVIERGSCEFDCDHFFPQNLTGEFAPEKEGCGADHRLWIGDRRVMFFGRYVEGDQVTISGIRPAPGAPYDAIQAAVRGSLFTNGEKERTRDGDASIVLSYDMKTERLTIRGDAKSAAWFGRFAFVRCPVRVYVPVQAG
jgi:hypothetical protein